MINFGFLQPTIFDPTGGQNNINLATRMPASQGDVQNILGVNNGGMMVASAYTKNGSGQSVLLNPNPAPGPVGVSFSYTATAQANSNSVITTNAPAATTYEEHGRKRIPAQVFNDSLNDSADVMAYNHDGSSLDIISQMSVNESFLGDFHTHYLETTADAVIQIGTSASIPAGTPLESGIVIICRIYRHL